jgi:hypothetical protein
METELPSRIETFSQTGTLGNLIDRPLPAVLSLFHGLPRGGPAFPDMGAPQRKGLRAYLHELSDAK